LEDRGSKDDEMPRGMWKVVEVKAGKIRVVETKGRRNKRESK